MKDFSILEQDKRNYSVFTNFPLEKPMFYCLQ